MAISLVVIRRSWECIRHRGRSELRPQGSRAVRRERQRDLHNGLFRRVRRFEPGRDPADPRGIHLDDAARSSREMLAEMAHGIEILSNRDRDTGDAAYKTCPVRCPVSNGSSNQERSNGSTSRARPPCIHIGHRTGRVDFRGHQRADGFASGAPPFDIHASVRFANRDLDAVPANCDRRASSLDELLDGELEPAPWRARLEIAATQFRLCSYSRFPRVRRPSPAQQRSTLA